MSLAGWRWIFGLILVGESIALSSLDVLLLSGVILPYFVKLLLLTLSSLFD